MVKISPSRKNANHKIYFLLLSFWKKQTFLCDQVTLFVLHGECNKIFHQFVSVRALL